MVAASTIVIHDRRYANDEIGGLDHLASWIIQFNSIQFEIGDICDMYMDHQG